MLDKELLIEDLALLVRKLAHRLKQAHQGDELTAQALTFLKRHNLEQSPLPEDKNKRMAAG